MISESRLTLSRRRAAYSYSFGYFGAIWGRATCRHAWHHYALTLAHWPELRETAWLDDILCNAEAVRQWRGHFDHYHRVKQRAGTWDTQWQYSFWVQGGLAAIPAVNLISNVGLRADATHTTGSHAFAALPIKALRFPLASPPQIERDEALDAALIATKLAPPAPATGLALLRRDALPRRLDRKLLPPELRRRLVQLWRSVRQGKVISIPACFKATEMSDHLLFFA